MTNEPTHLDLFSGIGGFALAAQRVGFRTIAFSEIEPYCCAVLLKHWPNVSNSGDIRSLDGGRFRGVDLLTAGVPCQPASLAGKRRGSVDDRWLWPEALRILGEAKPTFAVFENPPGILTLSGGLEFERLLLAMEGHGYTVQPVVIPACALDARHKRDRVWVVANAENPRGEQPHPTAEKGWSLSPPEREKGASAIGSSGQALVDARDRRGWSVEPDVGRMAHGISNRMDRLRCLGNSIVPQVAQVILRGIREMIG